MQPNEKKKKKKKMEIKKQANITFNNNGNKRGPIGGHFVFCGPWGFV